MGFRLRVLQSKHITKRYEVGKRNEGGGAAHRVGARGQGKGEGRCGREAAVLVKVGRELSTIIARGMGSTSKRVTFPTETETGRSYKSKG